MTIHISEQVLQVIAADDFTASDRKYKLITIGGTIAATTRSAAGPLITAVRSGGFASAVIEGITKLWAAAAVTSVGWPWVATTSGYVTNAGSGDVTGGRFLETCNSGDIVKATVDLKGLGYHIA